MTSSWDLSGGFPVGVGLASKASAAPSGSPRAPPSHTWADQRNHGSAGAARRASPLHHFLLPPPGTATGRPAPGSSTVLRSCRQPAGSSRRDHSQRGSRGVAGHGNWLTATDQRPSEPCGHPAPSARGARERRRSPAAPLGLPARVVLLSQRHAPLPAPRSGSSTGLELGVGGVPISSFSLQRGGGEPRLGSDRQDSQGIAGPQEPRLEGTDQPCRELASAPSLPAQAQRPTQPAGCWHGVHAAPTGNAQGCLSALPTPLTSWDSVLPQGPEGGSPAPLGPSSALQPPGSGDPGTP